MNAKYTPGFTAEQAQRANDFAEQQRSPERAARKQRQQEHNNRINQTWFLRDEVHLTPEAHQQLKEKYPNDDIVGSKYTRHYFAYGKTRDEAQEAGIKDIKTMNDPITWLPGVQHTFRIRRPNIFWRAWKRRVY